MAHGQHTDKRYRKFVVEESYEYASHDADGNFNGLTADQWKANIRERNKKFVDDDKILSLTWNFHDADTLDDGNPKGLHVHENVEMKDAKEESVIAAMFGVTRLSNVKHMRSISGAYQYLIHVSKAALRDKKHIYDFSQIEYATKDDKFDLMARFYPTSKDATDYEDEIDNMLYDVRIGQLSIKSVEEKFYSGTDSKLTPSSYAKLRTKFEDAYRNYLVNVIDWYSMHSFCKTVIYIQGGGGEGKTTVAQSIIAPHFMAPHDSGAHVPSAPMKKVTYDPTGTYKGETVSVLNEMHGGYWNLEGMCELFDPTHASLAGSRYNDKPYFPELVIMTSSTDLETFIYDLFMGYMNGNSKGDDCYEMMGEYERIYDNDPNAVKEIKYHGLQLYSANKGRIKQSQGTDASTVWDKLWQVRRRIPIYITLHDGNATFYVLDYSKKTVSVGGVVPEEHIDCYITLGTVPYSLDLGNTAVNNKFLECLDYAINYYYEYNKHSITPKTLQRPVIDFKPKGDKK